MDFDPSKMTLGSIGTQEVAEKKEHKEADYDVLGEFELDPLERRYLGPLLKYMTSERLDNVKEVVINRPGEIGFEYADGSWEFIEAPELTLDQLMDAARMLANRFGQIFSNESPVMSCKMSQGHRVQVVAGHLCPSEYSMTIRISRFKRFTMDDFHITPEQQEQIKDYIVNAKTLLVSGGTASGKTTFLNTVLPLIPEDERLITMEDVPELKVPHRNHVPLLFQSTGGDFARESVPILLNSCLRMRPDRILLGEIRKENAFAFCSAINTGHEGSMATIHANNPKMAMDAVMNRVLMNGDLPESAIQALFRQLQDDIKGVVQVNRMPGGKVKGYFVPLDKGNTDEIMAKFAEAGTEAVTADDLA